MDGAEATAGGGRIETAGTHEEAPEDDGVSVAVVGAGWKQIAWLDDRRASASRVRGQAELTFDVSRIDPGSAAGDARDHRRGRQVHEHVPGLAQHDGLFATHTVNSGDGDRGVDCAHGSILARFCRVSLRIAWISHCPVKGLAVRRLDECELTEAGIAGDREFFLVDESNRLVNSKGLGALQQIVPRYDREAGSLTLEFPDGTTVSQEVAVDGSLRAGFWRGTVDVRVVDGPWSDAISDYAGRALRLVRASGPATDRRRGGAATILGTGSLRALARALGVAEVDERRFRMNFGVDGLEAHQEDEWLGRRVRLGEAVVVPRGNVGRCAVTTQNPDSGTPDLDTLKALAAYRQVVEATEPLPFGVYAAVAEPAGVRVGDTVELA